VSRSSDGNQSTKTGKVSSGGDAKDGGFLRVLTGVVRAEVRLQSLAVLMR